MGTQGLESALSVYCSDSVQTYASELVQQRRPNETLEQQADPFAR